MRAASGRTAPERFVQFAFDDHVLDVDRRELRRSEIRIAVEPQVFDLLVYLVEQRDRVVSKDDLIASVWGGRSISDSTLTSRINAARKAIGDSGDTQKLIRTVQRKGLRFVGQIREQTDASEPAGAASIGLDAPSPALALPDRPAIAVLPFVNMSGEPEQEYFSDGISEDIITALSKLRWFFVIARNSSFVYKGRAVHLKQVASELGVRYVLEGSVRKGGDRVRITAQLNDVTTGSHIWAERYDRELADVFAVQDEITEAIVAAIEPQLYAAENFRSRRKPPDSLDAWDLVMRALSHYGRVTRQDNVVAQALLEKAVAIDPNYGQALGMLATSHTFSAHRRWEEGDLAARRALRLSPRDPFSATYYGIAAYAQFVGRNYDDAIRLKREAIRQRADFVGSHRVLTAAAAMAGQDSVAKAALQELRRAQPNVSLAWIASEMPMQRQSDMDHYLEAFRRAGLK